jgi:hypothetical protein
MQPNVDNLSPLERQLAARQPAATGLDVDAMLFAAGRAAGMQAGGPRWAWPMATCSFALLSLALGAALIGERSERMALADRLNRQSAEIADAVSPVPPAAQPPAADSYLAARRVIETDTDAWPARPDRGPESPSAAAGETPVLHAWPSVSADLLP